MATTQVYTCDICKNSKSKDGLAMLEIRCNGIHIKDSDSYGGIRIDICADCLKKKGFVVEHKTREEMENAANQNKVTLEDKVYDILEDMGVAFVE